MSTSKSCLPQNCKDNGPEGPALSLPPIERTSSSVLLVEDDRNMQELLCTALGQDNICLACAAEAHEALGLLRQKPFDLVILDLGLPGADGFEVLKGMPKQAEGTGVPVIVLTALTQTRDKLRAFDLGAVDYVTKPCAVEEFRARVRGILRSKRLQDQLAYANHKLNEARLVAEEAARSKAAFLASMSHEIRTPMNGVIAMTGLLLETELHADQREFVETIRTSGESLLTIINDILNISKIESGKLELERHPLDLRACVEEALDIISAKAAEKQLDLMYEVDEQAPGKVLGDITRLRQILVNLVGNSIKFTPKGEITVQVKAHPAAGVCQWEMEFAVRDTGIGIPPNRLNRLFRTFTQVDSSTTRQYGGTGLGLAISKGLVEAMGGKIWVESQEGLGSTFLFRIPMEAAERSISPPNVTRKANLSGLRLLVVDDNPSHGRILSQHAERWGMTAQAVTSLAEALQKLGEGELFHLALVDLQMPGVTVGQVVEQLQTNQQAKALPVVGMTSVKVLTEAHGATGLAGCVSKPIKPGALANMLERAVSGRQATATPKLGTASDKVGGKLGERIPLRVLLTDDNVINQKVASRLLQQMGYKVDIANNGQEAIQALERQAYDLVFMDVQMPVLDGLEATRRIRQKQQAVSSSPHLQRPIYIIAMTANAMQGDREKCLGAGMNDYLPKPIRPEAIQSAIERLTTTAPEVVKNARDQEAKSAEASPPQEKSSNMSPETTPLLAPQNIVQAPVSIDMERLLEFSGGDKDNLLELVGLYLQQTSEQVVNMKAAFKQGDAVRISRLAHSCAGASSTCGIIGIVPPLRKLEQATALGELTGALELIEAINGEFERVRNYLESYQKSLTAGDLRLKAI